MPNTTTISANEEETCQDHINWILNVYYDEGMPEGLDAGDIYKKHDLVSEWIKWCSRKYPGTSSSQDWADKVLEAGEHVDIRVLIRGQPIAGYAILQFLEVCCAVDKALCGTDAEAFAAVKLWHMPEEMSAYKYLLSSDMRQWWTKELVELNNEIESPSPNLVSLSWKIMDLSRCLARFDVVLDSGGTGIATQIWTTMEEDNMSAPPAGTEEAIFERVQGLRDSLDILRKALKRRKQEDTALDVPPTSGHRYAESTS